MEGYARHSRSQFRAAPPPPSSAGAAFYNKSYTNDAASGRNGFMAYDDVFGGPPKFGATPFAPRAEDYSEIFESFRSGRSSSIPMLDLPPVDDSDSAFEALGCSGFEYSEIFGGFDFSDFAVSYDELFRRSDASDDSSGGDWTPAGTESVSEECDPDVSSGRNQYYLDVDFHETLEDNIFDVSELIQEPQLSSGPGYGYVVEGFSMRKEDERRFSSGVADDFILCEDDSGNISVETPWKTASIQPHGCVEKQSHDYDKKAEGAHEISLSPSAISVSDVSLRTDPSQLPPPSRPPTIVDRKKDPTSSTSDYEEHGRSNTAETISEGGSVDLFDVELNAGSSSIESAAAMKEVMDGAKVRLNNAKELMKTKKDGVKGTPFMDNDFSRDEKVRMVFDESISRDDELQSSNERESNVVQIYWEEMQDATEESQVLPDPLQPEDAVSGAAEPVQIKVAKIPNSSLDPGLTEGDCEWKVTTECYELVNNCNSRTEPSQPDSIMKPVQEMNNCHFGNADGSTISVKQLKQNMETFDASINETEDSISADEASGLKENRRRLRATKAASRKEFHEMMVKVAENVHGTVISDHMETVKRRKEGPEGDGADLNPEMWLVGEKKERRFDPAAQQLHYEKKSEEETYLAGNEIRSEDDLVLGKCNEIGKEDYWFKENKRRGTEVAAREETLQRVKEVAEREVNGRGLDDVYQTEEKVGVFVQEEADAIKRAPSLRDEKMSVLNEALEQKEDGWKGRRNEKLCSNVRLKKTDGESRERVNEMWEKETQKVDQSEESMEEAAMPDYYGKKVNESFDSGNYERHDVATEMEQLAQAMEMMYECSPMNKDQKMESEGDLQAGFKITEQDSDQETNLEMESEYIMSFEISTLDETDNYTVPETACECEEFKSSNLPTNLYEEDIRSTAMTCEYEEKLENHVAEDMPMDEEKAESGSRAVFGEMEPKVAEVEDVCMSTRYLQKTEAGQSTMSEREGNVQKQSPPINTNQKVGKDVKAAGGDLDAKAREKAEMLKRNEESERECLREIQLEKERERERELEKDILRKFEEERERERELEKDILRKFEEERERERERELEKERLRKVREEREKELEKLRLRRLEELREREREKELEKDHLRKVEEERQREREKDLEKERLRKLEEEWEREREREKDRMGDEFKLSAARERSSIEARERAERANVERATAEARQRAMNEARERLEKACAEAREKSLGKPSKEAQLRVERAAVERATAEARERAIEKAMAERTTFETRERIERYASEKFSSSYRNVELRHTSSSNDLWNSSKSDGVEGESNQRCKARLERHRRTVDRVAKALAEKNMRDLIAQREQAERNRLAETLDVDIKRWSSGKEGNLRALLSTLQYILGPDSGWKPIPLTEVITSAAVKKAYRKATLCVHPDKLQQRGATIQQKYICEKVFDLLKDAWNRFNSEER